MHLRVVGIVRRPLDLGDRGASGGVLILMPAFNRAYGNRIGSWSGAVLRVRTRAGNADAFSPEITKADLQHEVEWLADPKREGRMTGSPGAQATASWLVGYFRALGLKSFGDSFTLPFQFNAGERVILEKNRLEITSGGAQLSTLNSQPE